MDFVVEYVEVYVMVGDVWEVGGEMRIVDDAVIMTMMMMSMEWLVMMMEFLALTPTKASCLLQRWETWSQGYWETRGAWIGRSLLRVGYYFGIEQLDPQRNIGCPLARLQSRLRTSEMNNNSNDLECLEPDCETQTHNNYHILLVHLNQGQIDHVAECD